MIENDPAGRDSWYVDLVSVDLMVPTDGRHPRMLDHDDFADALAHESLTLAEAIDGLRRWQRFLDRHIYAGRVPIRGLSDFPPTAIADLAALPAPFGPPVRWED